MAEATDGCVTPARGPIAVAPADKPVSEQAESDAGRPVMVAQVGKPAPEFEASAFVEGRFQNIRLSDFRGKWVALCFYPGDFTFV